MARPREFDDHKVEAYQLYIQLMASGGDVSAQNINIHLDEAHPEGTASYRLITNWVKEFKGQDAWQVLLDSPFQWNLMEKYGLPWEAGKLVMDILFVLEIWRVGQRERAELNRREYPRSEIIVTPYLSVREALWCWRVHLASPEIGTLVGDRGDIYYLALQFSAREVAADILKKPFDVADLEALLVYKPWVDVGAEERRHRAYHNAVEQGTIPSLPSFELESTMIDDLLQASGIRPDAKSKDVYRRNLPGVWGTPGKHPEILTSQAYQMWLESRKEQDETQGK